MKVSSPFLICFCSILVITRYLPGDTSVPNPDNFKTETVQNVIEGFYSASIRTEWSLPGHLKETGIDSKKLKDFFRNPGDLNTLSGICADAVTDAFRSHSDENAEVRVHSALYLMYAMLKVYTSHNASDKMTGSMSLGILGKLFIFSNPSIREKIIAVLNAFLRKYPDHFIYLFPEPNWEIARFTDMYLKTKTELSLIIKKDICTFISFEREPAEKYIRSIVTDRSSPAQLKRDKISAFTDIYIAYLQYAKKPADESFSPILDIIFETSLSAQGTSPDSADTVFSGDFTKELINRVQSLLSAVNKYKVSVLGDQVLYRALREQSSHRRGYLAFYQSPDGRTLSHLLKNDFFFFAHYAGKFLEFLSHNGGDADAVIRILDIGGNIATILHENKYPVDGEELKNALIKSSADNYRYRNIFSFYGEISSGSSYDRLHAGTLFILRNFSEQLTFRSENIPPFQPISEMEPMHIPLIASFYRSYLTYCHKRNPALPVPHDQFAAFFFHSLFSSISDAHAAQVISGSTAQVAEDLNAIHSLKYTLKDRFDTLLLFTIFFLNNRSEDAALLHKCSGLAPGAINNLLLQVKNPYAFTQILSADKEKIFFIDQYGFQILLYRSLKDAVIPETQRVSLNDFKNLGKSRTFVLKAEKVLHFRNNIEKCAGFSPLTGSMENYIVNMYHNESSAPLPLINSKNLAAVIDHFVGCITLYNSQFINYDTSYLKKLCLELFKFCTKNKNALTQEVKNMLRTICEGSYRDTVSKVEILNEKIIGTALGQDRITFMQDLSNLMCLY